MFKNLQKNRAQSLSEYSLILIVVLGAIISMSMLARRALLGKFLDTQGYMMDTVRAARDQILNEKALINEEYYLDPIEREYEPYYTYTESTTDHRSRQSVTISGGGVAPYTSFQRQHDDRTNRRMYREESPATAIGGT